jgi:hypothetical protein
VKYAFVEKHRRQYGVPALCEALQVSRSGYYAARHRGPIERQKRRVDLTGSDQDDPPDQPRDVWRTTSARGALGSGDCLLS